MSIVLGEIGRVTLAGLIGCFPASPEITGASPEVEVSVPVEVDDQCSSLIGRNNACSESDSEGSPEVESRLKGPLETMDALEEALPFRQGISWFPNGKSKSFTYLADAVSPASSAKNHIKLENECMNHIKLENECTRKRKNIFLFTDMLGELCNSNLLQKIDGGTPKKPTNAERSTALANHSPSSSSGSNSSNSEDKHEQCQLLIPCHPTGSAAASPGTDTSPLSPPLPKTFTLSTKSFSRTNLSACSSPIS
ncbi:hypothetical protein IHE45_18G009200 [Dioscorea alata]|uniref:Uncharacterized protein n=1 Tax=Dioscorea alata TaxID=55571 RepID=A0ACB7U572_DIOAL|nr:hypothetical protein IHE45_18G009200 [Dioscorea alata]